ncbi:DUF6146 family protein [Mangrovimonas cancribranchiae]|uniref:DUF6146 family protein n=1 Tax=Mangrovimonas cancribranchiae TaxID=3080055 RepID=A0AAU6P011_9FLAO
MKTWHLAIIVCVLLIGCKTSKTVTSNHDTSQTVENDTVRISSDEIEYEIIIIEPGFNTWLVSTAKPEGFYSQSFLENRNWIYVTEWNQRVLQPQRYNPNLYEMRINYQKNIDYGYELNYKLYNYFIYFQLKYKQQLAGFVPRI